MSSDDAIRLLVDESLKLQGVDRTWVSPTGGEGTEYGCGCWRLVGGDRPGLRTCGYHEGFVDGADAAFSVAP